MLVNSIFSFFPQCFQKGLYIESLQVRIVLYRVNQLPNERILGWSKFKGFHGGEISLLQNRTFCGKGENSDVQHFLLFRKCF